MQIVRIRRVLGRFSCGLPVPLMAGARLSAFSRARSGMQQVCGRATGGPSSSRGGALRVGAGFSQGEKNLSREVVRERSDNVSPLERR